MKRIVVGVFLLFSLCAVAHAQAVSSQLMAISDELKDKITKEMPGWAYRSIEPIEGSKNTIIQHWELGNMALRIAVIQYDSESRATEFFNDGKYHLRLEEKAAASRGRELHLIKGDLPGVGTEAFTWDIRGSEAVAFRNGSFLVFVSLVRPEPNNDAHFSRVFAAHAASVLALK